ncbi:MAG: S41 family peptidase [Candidatus Aminicenantales bacterium]
MRYPDIYNSRIVFSYGGDLYVSPVTGKNVKRLTDFPGEELLAKFSPDGEQIAFTAEFEGNKDIYVMPAQGGKAKRLTYHPAAEYVVDWQPDGKRIIFRSNGSSSSYRFNRLHAVPLQGGLPTVLELPEAELSGYNDTGDKVAFCRTGLDALLFKRYCGGMAPTIWTYDFSTRQAELVIADPSINHYPVWIGEHIYFVSDRGESREQNLWEYDCQSKNVRQITFYRDWGVRRPSKGGDEIIFENEGGLRVYNTKNGTLRSLHIEVPRAADRLTARTIEAKEFISGSPVLSADGKKVILTARGDLFLLEPEKRITKNMTRTPGANERYPVWSPRGKRFAYISDRSGEDQVYIQDEDDAQAPSQVSHCIDSRLGALNWSPDGKTIGYADHRACFYLLDIESGETNKIFFNAYLGSDKFVSASWSPDSRWLAYASGSPNWFSSIYLYSLENGRSHRVTDEFVHSSNPQFDPGGRYLYWIAAGQVNVADSYWDNLHYLVDPARIVVATLQSGQLSPFSPGRENEAEDTEGLPFPLRIDLEGLGRRVTALPIEDSNYSNLLALESKLIYQSEPAKGEASIRMFDLVKKKEALLMKGAGTYSPAAQAGTLVYRTGSTIGIRTIGADQEAGDGPIDLSDLKMTIDCRKEWRQIFFEAWRIQRDFFFDEKLRGVDWPAMKRKYETLLPFVASRRDLNDLIEDLFSELGQSHVEINGGDLPELPPVKNGILGIDLTWDENVRLYRIAKICRGQNWDPERTSPLTLPGLDIKAGDYLLAIDGVPLRERVNPDSLLENKAGATVALTVHEKPAWAGSRTVKVKAAEFSGQRGDLLRYNDWVLGNLEKVNRATGGKVGYIHIPDTYYPGMESFFRYFYSQLDKQALIIDIRFNSGGYPPDWMIERLNRKLGFYSHMPHGKAALKEPDPVFDGLKVCVANEWAESGGDLFAAVFRQWNSGLIIGRRTSGNLASTGGFRLIDGGVVIYPAQGPRNGQGESIIENAGIIPDIDIVNRPDEVIRGRDPQLELSIDEIMKELRAKDKRDSPIR